MVRPYRSLGLLDTSPFESVDAKGVGRLVRLAIEDGRHTRPGLTMGVCGQHAADPDSIGFFDACGVNYLSCPAPDIALTRYAAGWAARRSDRDAASDPGEREAACG